MISENSVQKTNINNASIITQRYKQIWFYTTLTWFKSRQELRCSKS